MTEPLRYNVEQGVPIPAKRVGATTPPIREMAVGDSIVFKIEIRNSVQSIASRIKRVEGKEFTTSKISDTQCRIWRTK